MSTITTTNDTLSNLRIDSCAIDLVQDSDVETRPWVTSWSRQPVASSNPAENSPRRSQASTRQEQSQNQYPIDQFLQENAGETTFPTLSKAETVLIISTLTGITAANSMSTGLFTIAIPRIAEDINLPDNLLLWLELVSHSLLVLANF
jgi:hypothetical protein